MNHRKPFRKTLNNKLKKNDYALAYLKDAISTKSIRDIVIALRDILKSRIN